MRGNSSAAPPGMAHAGKGLTLPEGPTFTNAASRLDVAIYRMKLAAFVVDDTMADVHRFREEIIIDPDDLTIIHHWYPDLLVEADVQSASAPVQAEIQPFVWSFPDPSATPPSPPGTKQHARIEHPRLKAARIETIAPDQMITEP
jgi:hypothetical protein